MTTSPVKIRHSVLVITFNQAEYIDKSIGSLFSDSVWPDEVIIADDCSTDGTRQVLQNIQQKYPGRITLLLNQRNLGIYDNLNQLIGLPTGDMVHLLAGDDWYEPGMFARMNQEIAERGLNPRQEAFILMPDYYAYNGYELLRRSNRGKKVQSLFKSTLRQELANRQVGYSAGLYRNCSKYRADLGIWAEAHHTIALARFCEKCYLMDEAYPVYRVGIGVSARTPPLEQHLSYLKALDFLLSDLSANLDKRDRSFIEYEKFRYQALVDGDLGRFARFLKSFSLNLGNGVRFNDLRGVISAYTFHRK